VKKINERAKGHFGLQMYEILIKTVTVPTLSFKLVFSGFQSLEHFGSRWLQLAADRPLRVPDRHRGPRGLNPIKLVYLSLTVGHNNVSMEWMVV
jgi:hypothetical protein